MVITTPPKSDVELPTAIMEPLKFEAMTSKYSVVSNDTIAEVESIVPSVFVLPSINVSAILVVPFILIYIAILAPEAIVGKGTDVWTLKIFLESALFVKVPNAPYVKLTVPYTVPIVVGYDIAVVAPAPTV